MSFRNSTSLRRSRSSKLPPGYVLAGDGLPALKVKEWTADKLVYVRRYIFIFTTGMRKKWQGLTYIDLFAGPGKCAVEESGREEDGSPLLALKAQNPFTKYIFVEKDKIARNALKERIRELGTPHEPIYIEGDCNKRIGEIVQAIPRGTLSFAFIDPTGVDLRFETIKQLVRGRSIDLLMLFPEGMAIKRNLNNLFSATPWQGLAQRWAVTAERPKSVVARA